MVDAAENRGRATAPEGHDRGPDLAAYGAAVDQWSGWGLPWDLCM
mgnify:CR=1 FL=1